VVFYTPSIAPISTSPPAFSNPQQKILALQQKLLPLGLQKKDLALQMRHLAVFARHC